MTLDLSYTYGRARVMQASQQMGWEKKEVKCSIAAVIIQYPSKWHRSSRSVLTAVLCNWSMYNFSNHTQQTWSVTLLAPDA